MKYKFGEKLRKVRERKGMTLKEVAGKARVSESLVSQIERNKVSPSVDTLLQLADILDIDYEHLFRDYRQKRQVALLRAGERAVIRRGEVMLEQLSLAGETDTEPAIEAFLLEVDPGGEQGDREYGHTGREFGLLLEGCAELIYGNEKYQLEEGDTVSFPSDIPHIFKNIGKEPLRAVWVVTPPRKIFRT